jgi:hypothetical protein
MPTIKLTKRAPLDAIKPEAKCTVWFDSEHKGFGMKVEPTGVMTWIFECRPDVGGRGVGKKRMTLGKVVRSSRIRRERKRKACLTRFTQAKTLRLTKLKRRP